MQNLKVSWSKNTNHFPCGTLLLCVLHETVLNTPLLFCTAWKESKYGVFSGPYLPAFGLNTETYSVWMQENTDQKKLRIWTLFEQCCCLRNEKLFAKKIQNKKTVHVRNSKTSKEDNENISYFKLHLRCILRYLPYIVKYLTLYCVRSIPLH